jgi:hypothetical protein
MKLAASAYYLGRDLAAGSDVPIGIVDINLGSAFVNGWLSREALLDTERLYGDRVVSGQVAKYEAQLEAEEKGVPFGKAKTPPQNTLQATLFPAAGFNGTLSPLAGIGFKAVVLQLGNDYPYMPYERLLASANPFDGKALDEAYAETYDIRKVGFRMEDKVVPRVTREWRKVLGDVELPFGLIVPPGSDLSTLAQHHREMRELQRLVALDNPNVGIILPGTGSIPLSAQPADESLLAARCRAWLEGAVYNKPGVSATGPLFDRLEANYNEATVYFKEGTAKGLKAAGTRWTFSRLPTSRVITIRFRRRSTARSSASRATRSCALSGYATIGTRNPIRNWSMRQACRRFLSAANALNIGGLSGMTAKTCRKSISCLQTSGRNAMSRCSTVRWRAGATAILRAGSGLQDFAPGRLVPTWG